jgi:CheY-like chemotaxis protein
MAVNDWIDLQEKSPIRFLVVEDDPRDQELFLDQLRKVEMAENALFVPDASQALDFFIEDSRNSSECRLIALFLDLKLPGMSGIELLQRIRAIPGMEDFPVIVMTAYDNPGDLKECQRLKVMRYIEKPVTFSAFSRAVASVFRHMRAWA